ncbi:MAG: type I-E CRISPR-associated protein Cse2/CasB [Candidatus Kapabacteria bacterium]|jgi:CRISPR type I-E-associated protein CasB/Cse2|nr:type I-E CRISPR-associated protein Cse2/CasB [Candidatus Kapabacteria bacterium]
MAEIESPPSASEPEGTSESTNKSPQFYWKIDSDRDATPVLRAWFTRLHGTPVNTPAEYVRMPDKGARAELRRCRTPDKAAMTPCCGELFRDLQVAKLINQNDETAPRFEQNLIRIGIIAGVASHLYADSVRGTVRLGRQMSSMQGGEEGKPLVSEARFRRLLLSHDSPEELMVNMIRIVQQIDTSGSSLNVFDIANTLWWFDFVGTRQRLAYDYYTFLPQAKK